jgi:hypothetical protein
VSTTDREKVFVGVDSFVSQWIYRYWGDVKPRFTTSRVVGKGDTAGEVEHFVLLWTNDKLPQILAGIWTMRYTDEYHKEENRNRMYVMELESVGVTPRDYHPSPDLSLPMALVAMMADFALLDCWHVHLWPYPVDLDETDDDACFFFRGAHNNRKKGGKKTSQADLFHKYTEALKGFGFKPSPYQVDVTMPKPLFVPNFGPEDDPDVKISDVLGGMMLKNVQEKITTMAGTVTAAVKELNDYLVKHTICVSRRVYAYSCAPSDWQYVLSCARISADVSDSSTELRVFVKNLEFSDTAAISKSSKKVHDKFGCKSIETAAAVVVVVADGTK